MARHLLEVFGSIGGVLSTSAERLRSALPNECEAIEQLRLTSETLRQALRSRVSQGPILGDEQALIEYLFYTMAFSTNEQFRVLFLDARNCLISDEIVATGCVRGVVVHPRQIMRRAVEVGATALILVHNHPSGDPTPSPADIDTTRSVAAAGDVMGLRLQDHLIVARSGYSSLKRGGHI